MAKAEKVTEIIVQDLVVLKLTEEEAGAFLLLALNVGGTFEGPRGKISAIADAIVAAGVAEPDMPDGYTRVGSVCFNRTGGF